jgi:ABC-type transport system involved in multi-copper enzyme maturation permease subunit
MANPLIQREFFGILRRKRAIAMLIALTVAFSLMVVLRWPSDAQVEIDGGRARQLFRAFSYALMAGILLLVPAYPAASIVSEKNKGTLALLLNSPMKPWSIYAGKLGGVLLFSLLLVFASVPAAAACYAMGGIDFWRGFGLLYAVLILAAFQYATLGLMVSTYVQSTDGGVRVSYALTLSLAFLSLGPNYFYQGQAGLIPLVAEYLRYLSPLPPVMWIVGHASLGGEGLIRQSTGIPQYFILGSILTCVFMLMTVARLNYRIFDRPRSKGVITDERSLVVRLLRRFVFVVDPQRRKSSIPFLVNPVVVKEFRSRRFGRSHWLLRLVAICAVTSLLLTLAATMSTLNWGVETIGRLMVLLQVLLVVLITPSLAAGLISAERESGGWELLRMTPLSPRSILWGKLLSVTWTLLLVIGATLPGYLVMMYIKPVIWLQVYYVLICLAFTALLTVSISAAVGSLFSRTAAATTTSYIVLIILFLGPLVIWLSRDQPFGHATVQTALMLNPTGGALAVLDTPGFAAYDLIPISWWVSGVVSAVLLVLLSLRTWHLTRPL